MKRKPRSPQPPQDLRGRAEQALAKQGRRIEQMAEPEVQKLVHDLQVHQVELEMQNDELRRTQLALQESRDRFADLYDFAPLALLTLNQGEEVLEANFAAASLLSLERADLIRQKFSHFILAEAQDGFYLYCRQLLQTQARQSCELTLRSAAGSLLTVRVEGVAAQDPATHKTQFRLSLIDITERKEAEELVRQRTSELESANEKLRKEIASRVVAEESLLRMAEELKRSNVELEQFGYVASHDLQEPLRAVAGYVRLLEYRFPKNVDAKTREYITGAAEGATRMEHLITDLLTVSRLSTTGRPFTETNLEAPLGTALRTLQFSIRLANAKVTSDPMPTVRADESQMLQLFQNLIANSLKFRSERPAQIHIGARAEEGRWVVSIKDNSIGIEPQYFERIFQVFQRLHTRKTHPGTGIGLAICKKIVERHGGRIWVESQPGQGSTFYFSIPDQATR